jgi:hypothetical protein
MILEVLLNSSFMRGTPGALIEDAKGLFDRTINSDPDSVRNDESTCLRKLMELTKPKSTHFRLGLKFLVVPDKQV